MGNNLKCKKCGSKRIREFRDVKGLLMVEIDFEKNTESDPEYEFDTERFECAECGSDELEECD